ncbi:MAG: hypothetical protein R3B81_16345 [bacterium]
MVTYADIALLWTFVMVVAYAIFAWRARRRYGRAVVSRVLDRAVSGGAELGRTEGAPHLANRYVYSVVEALARDTADGRAGWCERDRQSFRAEIARTRAALVLLVVLVAAVPAVLGAITSFQYEISTSQALAVADDPGPALVASGLDAAREARATAFRQTGGLFVAGILAFLAVPALRNGPRRMEEDHAALIGVTS